MKTARITKKTNFKTMGMEDLYWSYRSLQRARLVAWETNAISDYRTFNEALFKLKSSIPKATFEAIFDRYRGEIEERMLAELFGRRA